MRYKTLGMMKDAGMGKDVNDLMAGTAGVPYLLANQRGQYLVTVSPFHRLTQSGFLLNSADGPTGQYIFVMDGEGAIYSASKTVVHHHSPFLAGGPVAAAGWWAVEYGDHVQSDRFEGRDPVGFLSLWRPIAVARTQRPCRLARS